jgi:hypothetical protein
VLLISLLTSIGFSPDACEEAEIRKLVERLTSLFAERKYFRSNGFQPLTVAASP